MFYNILYKEKEMKSSRKSNLLVINCPVRYFSIEEVQKNLKTFFHLFKKISSVCHCTRNSSLAFTFLMILMLFNYYTKCIKLKVIAVEVKQKYTSTFQQSLYSTSVVRDQ